MISTKWFTEVSSYCSETRTAVSVAKSFAGALLKYLEQRHALELTRTFLKHSVGDHTPGAIEHFQNVYDEMLRFTEKQR